LYGFLAPSTYPHKAVCWLSVISRTEAHFFCRKLLIRRQAAGGFREALRQPCATHVEADFCAYLTAAATEGLVEAEAALRAVAGTPPPPPVAEAPRKEGRRRFGF
jgi:hypothetical protein